MCAVGHAAGGAPGPRPPAPSNGTGPAVRGDQPSESGAAGADEDFTSCTDLEVLETV